MNRIGILLWSLVASVSFEMAGVASGEMQVEAKSKPTGTWKSFPTRTLDQLSGFSLTVKDSDLDQYGGSSAGKANATGFFHTRKIDGRWWFIDPDGGRFIHVGVASVSPGKSDINLTALQTKFGDTAGSAIYPPASDSNKGIVNNRYEPHTPALQSMKALNERVYSLADYFDK